MLDDLILLVGPRAIADILFSERRTRRLPTIRPSCGTLVRAAEGSRGADVWTWRTRGFRSTAGMVIGLSLIHI